MNIDNINHVIEYYESSYEKEKITPDTGGYIRIPSKSNKENILFSHSAKGDLSNKTFSFLKKLEN